MCVVARSVAWAATQRSGRTGHLNPNSRTVIEDLGNAVRTVYKSRLIAARCNFAVGFDGRNPDRSYGTVGSLVI